MGALNNLVDKDYWFQNKDGTWIYQGTPPLEEGLKDIEYIKQVVKNTRDKLDEFQNKIEEYEKNNNKFVEWLNDFIKTIEDPEKPDANLIVTNNDMYFERHGAYETQILIAYKLRYALNQYKLKLK
jgi:hypothetical protein